MSNIIGYTTIDQAFTSKPLTDLELAKRDLLNHFHIRKGEKWTNPEFGSNLPFYVFQPLDDITIDLIKQEVFEIVSFDPRFEVIENIINVDEDSHYVTINVKLMYVPSTTAIDLQVKFDKESSNNSEF